eukprot:4065723-Amphidinium_carterae.2
MDRTKTMYLISDDQAPSEELYLTFHRAVSRQSKGVQGPLTTFTGRLGSVLYTLFERNPMIRNHLPPVTCVRESRFPWSRDQ